MLSKVITVSSEYSSTNRASFDTPEMRGESGLGFLVQVNSVTKQAMKTRRTGRGGTKVVSYLSYSPD
jgi:hypothetical protein